MFRRDGQWTLSEGFHNTFDILFFDVQLRWAMARVPPFPHDICQLVLVYRFEFHIASVFESLLDDSPDVHANIVHLNHSL